MARTVAPGHSVRLPLSLYASAIKAAELRGLTVGKFVEIAVERHLEHERRQIRIDRYHDAKRQAAASRRPKPAPEDFGLPADFDLPPALRQQLQDYGS